MKNKCAGAGAGARARAGSSSVSSSSSSSCIINHEENNPKKKQKRPTTTTTGGRRRSKKTAKIVNNDDDAPPLPANAKHPRRSSIYRGVTRHRWTGRYEAHLWDKTTWNNIQNKRGRQIYLGAYDNEETAAHTYDLAALKYWGSQTTLNFPIETYTKEMEEMDKLSKEEYLASLRRRSSGFSRGVSKYRGVARHHYNGRWEARIGRVHGNKYLYLGTYSTQEEAAAAYDLAAIEHKGPNAVTNFDISHYADRLKHTHNNPDGPVAATVVDATNDTEQMLGKNTDTIIKYEQQTRKEDDEEDKEAEEWVLAIENGLEESPQCINNNNTTMDHQHEHGEEEQHPWSLCLDMGGGFNPFPASHITNGEMDLLDYFDDATLGGFEDDIDFMFDVPMENEGEDQLMRLTQGGDVNGPPQSQSNDHAFSITTSGSPSSSLSSSSNSTTTSVSCIYSSS